MTERARQQSPALPDAQTPAWVASTRSINQTPALRPELIEVAEGVYAALGFGISNIVFVVTARSVVVIDSTEAVCRAIVKACRGKAALTQQAKEALDSGRNHLVLELTDIVLTTAPDDGPSLALRTEALGRLAQSARNGVARNIYRSALERAQVRTLSEGRPE